MKYGLLIDFGLENCNYGDYVQTIAIEYLYNKMKIPSQDIIFISYEDLSVYDGEPLILPYSYVLGYLMDRITEDVRLSPQIIPVFLGVSIGVGFTRPLEVFTDPEKKWMELFKHVAPIGCRDETTRLFFEKLGIPAYLQGCITNILPQRLPGVYEKLLLVDCPIEILPYIPKELLQNAEILSNAENKGDLSIKENYNKIKQRYEYYRNNARLIVTSRYHVATPCNAMGIPSILLMRPFKDKAKDIRLDSLHPQIQLFASRDYKSIDWFPEHQEFSELKKSIFSIAASRVRAAAELYTHSEQIRCVFQKRIKAFNSLRPDDAILIDRFRNFVNENFSSPKNGNFYIWAASVLLCEKHQIPLAQIAEEINPNLQFKGWIDTYKTGILLDFPIMKPTEICLNENDFIIVATGTVIPDALKYFKQIGLSKSQYFIFFDTMATKSDLEREQMLR